MTRRIRWIDVFGTGPCTGNPLAVVSEADDLADEDMARLAAWTNLSETTFLLTPTDPAADYRVRIFTPSEELPFAGHPTLGSCHAWLADGGTARSGQAVVQECGVGLVTVRTDGPELRFAAPPLRRSGAVHPATVERVVGILDVDPELVQAIEWVDNGPGWIGVLVTTADAVRALRPGPIGDDFKIGVAGRHPAGGPADFEVRAFFGVRGETREDPATGSLNASLGQWLIGAGWAPSRYVATQGTVIGRAARITIDADDDGAVWVGGATVTVVDGHLGSGTNGHLGSGTK